MRSAVLFALLIFMAVPGFAAAEQLSMRLRIAWGGGLGRQWQGRMAIGEGTLSKPTPLGLEADEPGSMWIEDGALRVASPSSRTYDAVDVTVEAPREAALAIELGSRGAEETADVEIPLAELIRGARQSSLDAEGNRVVVGRAPGDELRVVHERSTMVFAPSDVFGFAIAPNLIDAPTGATMQCDITLHPAREQEVLWSKQISFVVPASGANPESMPVEIPLPAEAGAYDISISVSQAGFRTRLLPSRPVAERLVQVVVASREPRVEAAPVEWETVVEVNPINPAWWRKMIGLKELQRLPGFQGPIRSGARRLWSHPLGQFVRFDSGSEQPTWEAYPLPIKEPGTPHILSIEYPSDLAQFLRISVLEPNSAGALVPVGLDSGVFVPREAAGRLPRMLEHRLVFYPKTESPLVVLCQGDTDTPSVYGKIRVLAGPERLPSSLSEPAEDGRMVAAYLDRPLFPENFSATEVLDAGTGRPIDDWKTFQQAAIRLCDHLEYAGYNGLMLAVLADGSTLYPSRLLQPTPRYDSGELGTLGRDPIRKDVLELLLKEFDRRGLKLVPMIQFAGPLPELEAKMRNAGEAAEGIALENAYGIRWSDQHPTPRGLAAYYNPLDARVQAAMANVLAEVVGRYRHHRSFAGVAVRLSGEGYAILPGAEWGLDEATIARFAAESGLALDTSSGERSPALTVLSRHRNAWFRWRAENLTAFYAQLSSQVAATKPGAKLYLAGSDLLSSPSIGKLLRPELPQRSDISGVLLEVGLDRRRFAEHSTLVFMQPRPTFTPSPLHQRAGLITLNRALAPQLESPPPAALFYQPPLRQRLESFDAESPWGRDQTYTLLMSQPMATDNFSRKQIVEALAKEDTLELFEGGWLMPLGQESFRWRLFSLIRRLPGIEFETADVKGAPVVVRVGREQQQTYVYLLNPSPWAVRSHVTVGTPGETQLQELSDGAASPLVDVTDGATWTVTLQPYDLAVGRFTRADVRVVSARTDLPSIAEQSLGRRIRSLSVRASSLAGQPALDVLENPNFEKANEPDASQAIAGWSLLEGSGISTELVEPGREDSQFALRLSSKGEIASLRSEPFPVPRTARLAVSVWLRAVDVPQGTVLRLALEGPHDGRVYYRFAAVGGAGETAVAPSKKWTPYIFQVNDIPVESIDQMRVRFDLMGKGTYEIDDISLHHLRFSDSERIELSKTIATADALRRAGHLAECLQLVENYWSEFLLEYVVPQEAPVARTTSKRSESAPPVPKRESAEESGGLRRYVPRFLRF